jgi:hypothetical protein
MTTMTFDKLAYVDRLKAAGFNEPQARAMADGLDQALREEVATKSDVAGLRHEIDLFRVEVKSDLAVLRGEVKSDLDALRGEIKSDLGILRSEFKTDLGMLRGEFKGDLGGLRGELLAAMKADKIDLLKWVVVLIVGQTAVFTALKLLGR